MYRTIAYKIPIIFIIFPFICLSISLLWLQSIFAFGFDVGKIVNFIGMLILSLIGCVRILMMVFYKYIYIDDSSIKIKKYFLLPYFTINISDITKVKRINRNIVIYYNQKSIKILEFFLKHEDDNFIKIFLTDKFN